MPFLSGSSRSITADTPTAVLSSIAAFQNVIDLGTKDTTKITLFTPFIHMTKTDILRTGRAGRAI